MKLTNTQLKQIPMFGIAGNFADHLSQAGEDADFLQIKTAEVNAPKGIFPFYLPNHASFLGQFPVSHSKITIPSGDKINLQAEAEMGVLFNVTYTYNEDGEQSKKQISKITPIAFTALNDCSIRKPNARKISEKKNWGTESTGIATDWIEIDAIEPNGKIDQYCITAFLKREGEWLAYGINSPVKSYQYFYQKLLDWITLTLNTQQDFGPLENLHQKLTALDFPDKIIIALGATRYSPFGEKHYLLPEDQISICVYSEKKYSEQEIAQKIQQAAPSCEDFIVLHQTVNTL